MYFTYILKSLKDGKYYYGSTQDVFNRLKEHNNGRVTATKNRRPFVLHYKEAHDSQKNALQRELFFKKRSGYKWLKVNKII